MFLIQYMDWTTGQREEHDFFTVKTADGNYWFYIETQKDLRAYSAYTEAPEYDKLPFWISTYEWEDYYSRTIYKHFILTQEDMDNMVLQVAGGTLRKRAI